VGELGFTRAAVAVDNNTNRFPEAELSRRESLDFELLYLLETEPGLTQRELAERLGISLGRTNYCVRALLDKGVIKLANFRAARSKLGYVYVMTPKGIAQRIELSRRFLQRKLTEFERLKAQIETLQRAIPPE
jgi:EPS-associated MarR family transcriptional regulator